LRRRPCNVHAMVVAGGACVDARGRFQPPSWCRVPTDPVARKQSVRFLAEDTAGAAVVRPGDEVVLADKAVYTIGRADTGVDVRLRGDLASRIHAAICQDGEGRKFLVDLRSTHGTYLGGQRLEPNMPVMWQPEVRATLGLGPQAEVLALNGGAVAASSSRASGVEVVVEEDESSAVGVKRKKAPEPNDDLLAALYGDLPEAKVTKTAPRVEEKKWVELIPAPKEPTRIIFLDVDGVLRSVHGRTDFHKNIRTMLVNGHRVALTGDATSTNDNLAGIDFWTQAMHALKHIVQKTQAAVVLSSDWRKQEQLVDGINNQMREYGMPRLLDQTPDLDAKNVQGVLKALHSNVREKRAKEIRRWLKKNGAKIQQWVAIDDMDLTAQKKDELIHAANGITEPMPFLDATCNFVRCNPAVGLTMDLARLAVSILNGIAVSQEDAAAAYGGFQAAQEMDPNFQGMGLTTFVG